jgi:hypothetical protein
MTVSEIVYNWLNFVVDFIDIIYIYILFMYMHVFNNHSLSSAAHTIQRVYDIIILRYNN